MDIKGETPNHTYNLQESLCPFPLLLVPLALPFPLNNAQTKSSEPTPSLILSSYLKHLQLQLAKSYLQRHLQVFCSLELQEQGPT